MTSKLATTIIHHHQLAQSHAGQAIEHALEAGRLLAEQKGRLPHGAWLPYLASLGISPRQAQRYTRLAAHNTTALSHLTPTAALAAITTPRPDNESTALEKELARCAAPYPKAAIEMLGRGEDATMRSTDGAVIAWVHFLDRAPSHPQDRLSVGGVYFAESRDPIHRAAGDSDVFNTERPALRFEVVLYNISRILQLEAPKLDRSSFIVDGSPFGKVLWELYLRPSVSTNAAGRPAS